MKEGCAAFLENVAVSSMMGAGLALSQVPEHMKAAMIEKLAGDVFKVAVSLHDKIHNHLSSSATPPPTTTQPRFPRSADGFLTFDEALLELNIDENRLKKLVSEGELRAFREGDEFRFKRSEIVGLKGGLR